MTERALLAALYVALGNWRNVAATLGKFSAPMWAAIYKGSRHATIEQRNIIRAMFPGWPTIEKDAAEIVAASGVDNVVQVDKRPNTAILAAVSGDVLQVNIKSGVLPVDESAVIPVTLCYKRSKRRKRRPVETVSIPGIGSVSVKSKKFRDALRERVSAAAQRAACVQCDLGDALYI